MPDSNSTDRNLLIGVLALQMDFVNRDQLVAAMTRWVQNKSKTLAQIFLEQASIDDETHTLLDALVEKHIAKHNGDASQSLRSVSVTANVLQDMGRCNDKDVEHSLYTLFNLSPRPSTSTPASPAKPRDGTRFKILKPHARGGLGEVFIALDQELNRQVALKEIQDQHLNQGDARNRFLLEAEITGGLEHPSIVPVYGMGQYDDGRPYYAMRFIKGDSLKDAIERFYFDPVSRSPGERLVELRKLLSRFIHVCQAVAYAHSRGVVHRDLKPANVMLGKFGETLVVDWGLAKTYRRSISDDSTDSQSQQLTPPSAQQAEATIPGSALGTPAYMSPEQAAGKLEMLGPASDVYSLGATLFSLLTGQTAFDDPNIYAVLHKVEKGDFRPPRQVNPEVPKALNAICLKAMALRPDDRYASANELADDIENWLADEPVAAYRENAVERLSRFARRHSAWTRAGALALVLVACVSLGAMLLINQAREREAQAYKINNLQRDITAGLDAGKWSPDHVRHLEHIAHQLETLDANAAATQRRRIYEGFAKAVGTKMAVNRLDAVNLKRIDADIAFLKTRNATLAAALNEQRTTRLRKWEPIFSLAEPFDDLKEIFEPDRLKNEKKRITALPTAGPLGDPIIKSHLASSGNVQIQAVFAESWRKTPAVGVLLQAGDEPMYRFVVAVPEYKAGINDAFLSELQSFEDIAKSGARINVLVYRGKVPLVSETIPMPEAQPLTVTAKREGDRLYFQVNTLRQIVFEDPFLLTSSQTGTFGVFAPEGVEITRVAGWRQAMPLRPSPLETGDALFAKGNFERAIEEYQKQLRTITDEQILQEANYKLGLSLMMIDRKKESEEILEQLRQQLPTKPDPVKSRWPLRAAARLWWHYLERKEDVQAFRKAEDIQNQLAATYSFEELTLMVPAVVREEILDFYRMAGARWLIGWDTADNMKFVDQVIQLEQVLNASSYERRFTRWRKMDVYSIAGKRAEAIKVVQGILAEDDLTPKEEVFYTRDYVWLLILEKRFDDALIHLHDLLKKHSGDALYQQLLVERARVFVNQEKWDDAEKDMRRFFKDVPKESLDYAEWGHACLLMGFLHKRKGEASLALETWDKGRLANWPGQSLPPLPRGRILDAELLDNRDNAVTLDGMMGSLTGNLTEKDADWAYNTLVKGTGAKEMVVQAVVRRRFPIDFVHKVILEAYRSNRGENFCQKWAFRNIPLDETMRGALRLLFYEAFCAGAVTIPITPEMDRILFKGATDLIDYYDKGKFADEDMVDILKIWWGNTDPKDAWRKIAPKMQPDLTIPAASLFAMRYKYLKQYDIARRFIDQVLGSKDPAYEYLRQVATQQLQEMNRLQKQP